MSEYAHLLPPNWKRTVNAWLVEDSPSFDWGGYIVGEAPREAFLFGKGRQTAVLAGVPFVDEIFSQVGCQCVLLASIHASVRLTFGPKSGMVHERGRHLRARETRCNS